MGKGKKKYLIKRVYSLLIIFFSLLSCLFGSCSILFTSQEKIDELTEKFDNNLLQKNEKNEIKSIYKDMIWGGKFISPEASKILKYYISDHTDDLYINSEYFYKSEYIKKILKENENKEIIGPVCLKIKDDARIAYAVNGFYIDTNKKTVYQYIDFAPRNDKSTYTYFDLPKRRLKIADRLIRVFEEDGGCNPFTVYIQYE